MLTGLFIKPSYKAASMIDFVALLWYKNFTILTINYV
jgi:hypothetical protein